MLDLYSLISFGKFIVDNRMQFLRHNISSLFNRNKIRENIEFAGNQKYSNPIFLIHYGYTYKGYDMFFSFHTYNI
jgi:hypothetical protein